MLETLLLTMCCAYAVPDLIPEGWRGIAVTVRVEVAADVPRLCTRHVVTEGETFSSIATRLLGSGARWTEIAALNPGVEPTRLRVGDALWIPPRIALTPVEHPVFAYVDWLRPFRSSIAPLVDGPLPYAPRLDLVVYAVPAAQRVAFERAAKAGKNAVDAMVERSAIRVMQIRTAGLLVEVGNPARRRDDLYRIAVDDEGALALELASSVRYDAEGHELPAEPVHELPRRGGAAPWLLLLGASGAALLFRRRRAVTVATA